MNIVDCRPEKLQSIRARLRTTPSIVEALQLTSEVARLEQEIQASFAEVNRVARGWVFIPPR